MGYSTVRSNDLDSLYRRKEGAQYFLFITNIVMLLVGLAKPREPSSLEREYPGIGARASFDEGADVVSTRLPRHSITT